MIRWGVTDLGTTITFLWVWNLMRTWWKVLFNHHSGIFLTTFLLDRHTVLYCLEFCNKPFHPPLTLASLAFKMRRYIILDKAVLSILGDSRDISVHPLTETQTDITTTQYLCLHYCLCCTLALLLSGMSIKASSCTQYALI